MPFIVYDRGGNAISQIAKGYLINLARFAAEQSHWEDLGSNGLRLVLVSNIDAFELLHDTGGFADSLRKRAGLHRVVGAQMSPKIPERTVKRNSRLEYSPFVSI